MTTQVRTNTIFVPKRKDRTPANCSMCESNKRTIEMLEKKHNEVLDIVTRRFRNEQLENNKKTMSSLKEMSDLQEKESEIDSHTIKELKKELETSHSSLRHTNNKNEQLQQEIESLKIQLESMSSEMGNAQREMDRIRSLTRTVKELPKIQRGKAVILKKSS